MVPHRIPKKDTLKNRPLCVGKNVTRLSDNGNVTMPLTNINKHDAGDHRCTSENVVGTHSTTGVTIDVRCKYYVESTSESSDQMISLFSSL